MLIFIAILVLVCGITLFICNTSIVKPIHNLALAADDMAFRLQYD